jgi:hypothetical protein
VTNGTIRIQLRRGSEVGVHAISRRVGDKVHHDQFYLGKVIDRDKGIYSHPTYGTFSYDVSKGMGLSSITPVDVSPELIPRGRVLKPVRIVDFGSVCIFDQVLERSGFKGVLQNTLQKSSDVDTLLSLTAVNLIETGLAHKDAIIPWRQSYASIIYPSAKLQSARISDFMIQLGSEEIMTQFFKEYLPYINKLDPNLKAVIDSTGLPNAIKYQLAAVSYKNGTISRETKLIFVLDQLTSMPIFFRYVPGNIIDVSTLRTTISIMNAHKISVKHVILDAGYCSESNFTNLFEKKIPFLIRLCANRKLYKDLVVKYQDSIRDKANMVMYGERQLFGIRQQVNISGYTGYAYIMKDVCKEANDIQKLYEEVAVGHKQDMDADEFRNKLKQSGMFILISANKIAADEVLPLYYVRDKIEKIFDVGKNHVNLIPLRVHAESTLRGHLMLSFISMILYTLSNREFKKFGMTVNEVYLTMRGLKINMFENMDSIISEPDAEMKKIIKGFNFKLPARCHWG